MKSTPAIEIRGIKKSFGGRRETVLGGVDLSVPSRKTTFLLGPSGTGKSILLKHIVGLIRPDEGEIKVFGEPLPYENARRLDQLRMRFGVLFQGGALFDNMTVLQNVAFPLLAHRRGVSKSEVRSRTEETLRSVGLDPEVTGEKYPNQLSGGMQKRVALARAIILRPEILLYDEPTTGLDPVNRVTVEEMIAEAEEKLGLTNFVITHDIDAALALADYIAFLHEGRIVFWGPPAEFETAKHPVILGFLEAERRHRRVQT